MTRNKALLILMACTVLFETVTILGLAALGASVEMLVLGYVATLALGSLGGAEIVMRFDEPSQHR